MLSRLILRTTNHELRTGAAKNEPNFISPSSVASVAKKGKKWRRLGQVWRHLGAVWCRLGAVWRRLGQLWQQKNTIKPHFQHKNAE